METPVWLLVVKVLVWPAAIVIVSYIFMRRFRPSIEALLGRIREIGPSGLKAAPNQKQGSPDVKKMPVNELMREFDNPILREREAAIQKDLEKRDISSDSDKVRVLTRYLAATQLSLMFEAIYQLIWGSQIYILEHLNTIRPGDSTNKVKEIFYDDAVKRYPVIFADYSYENYLGFLKNAGFVVEEADVREAYANPRHPYTIGLLGSLPRLDELREEKLSSIEGLPPDLIALPEGCPFEARCVYAIEKCKSERPELEPVGPRHRIACWVDVTQATAA